MVLSPGITLIPACFSWKTCHKHLGASAVRFDISSWGGSLIQWLGSAWRHWHERECERNWLTPHGVRAVWRFCGRQLSRTDSSSSASVSSRQMMKDHQWCSDTSTPAHPAWRCICPPVTQGRLRASPFLTGEGLQEGGAMLTGNVFNAAQVCSCRGGGKANN